MTPIPADDPLREAAQAVVDAREPTPDTMGQLSIHLVRLFDAIDALRAALQQPAHPEPDPYHDLALGSRYEQEGAVALRADSHVGEGLDVERLAKAFGFVEYGADHYANRDRCDSCVEVAERLAVRYAALSKEQGPQEYTGLCDFGCGQFSDLPGHMAHRHPGEQRRSPEERARAAALDIGYDPASVRIEGFSWQTATAAERADAAERILMESPDAD